MPNHSWKPSNAVWVTHTDRDGRQVHHTMSPEGHTFHVGAAPTLEDIPRDIDAVHREWSRVVADLDRQYLDNYVDINEMRPAMPLPPTVPPWDDDDEDEDWFDDEYPDVDDEEPWCDYYGDYCNAEYDEQCCQQSNDTTVGNHCDMPVTVVFDANTPEHQRYSDVDSGAKGPDGVYSFSHRHGPNNVYHTHRVGRSPTNA